MGAKRLIYHLFCFLLQILGLDICAATLVGDAMRRGISGGQKKRLTTGRVIARGNKLLILSICCHLIPRLCIFFLN